MKKYLFTPTLAQIFNSEKDHALPAAECSGPAKPSRVFSLKPIARTLAMILVFVLSVNAAVANKFSVTTVTYSGPTSGTATYGTVSAVTYTIKLTSTSVGGTTTADNLALTWGTVPAGVTLSFVGTTGATITPASAPTANPVITPTATTSTITLTVTTAATTAAGTYGLTLKFTDNNGGAATGNISTGLSLVVNTAPLTVSSNNISKVYGTAITGGPGSGAFTSAGLKNGQTIGSVTISYGTGAAANASVAGSPYTNQVGVSAATGGTFNAANYTITYDPGDITVTPKTLTIAGAATSNKTYDGTTAATASGLLVGVVLGDVVNVSGGTFASKNVGTGIAVTVTLGGADAGNYTLTQPGLTANITAAALNIAATVAAKTYGTVLTGGTGFTGFTSTGLQNGETIGSVTVAYGTGAAANASVAGSPYTNQVTISAATGGTFTASNYTITYSKNNITVSPTALTISSNNVSKVYGATITGAAGSTAFTSAGLKNGETIGSVTITYGTGAAASASVAGSPYTNQVGVSAAIGGTFTAANYSITYDPGNITVTPKTLTVSGAAASNKTYDGTTVATITGGTLTGVISGDVVTIGTGTFASADVANNIAVSNVTLAGASAANYTLTQPANLKANITPANLTITAAISKVYGTDATGFIGYSPYGPTAFTTSGTVNGEVVTEVYFYDTNTGGGMAANANVGTTFTATPISSVVIFGFTIPLPTTGTNGFDAGNYNITYVPEVVTVTPAPLTITANNYTKAYGTAISPTTSQVTTGFSATGLQNGETVTKVTMTYGTGSAAAAAIGNYVGQVTPGPAYAGTFNPTNYTITLVSAEIDVVGQYNWIGTSANSNWNTPQNWSVGGITQTVNYPGITTSTDVVSIGVTPFTRQPTVTATPPHPVSTITFGTIPVTLTLNNSTALTTASNITFNSGSNVTINGPASPGAATLNIGGNFSNSGTVSFGSTVLVNFNGTGFLTTGTPVTFTNVSFTGGGAKTLSSGSFAVSSAGVLTMNNSTTLFAGGNLTLNSDASGSAAIAAIPSGSKISGNVSVQRYLSAQRGYRLASSPVNSGSQVSYSVNYVKNSLYVLATAGTVAGFDGPSSADNLDLFREDIPVCNSSFTCGNYRGINNLNSGTGSSPTYTIDGDPSAGYAIPVGTGFQLFTRGDKTAAALTIQAVPGYPGSAVTLTATGTLNQGQVTFKNWYDGSGNLGLSNTDPTVAGFNLVGNPYASTIDVSTAVGNASQTTGVYAPGVNYIYVYNPYYKSYDFCLLSNPTVHQHTATQYIASGQGFFIVPTATGTSLIFNESAKVPATQIPAGVNTYMSSASALTTATGADNSAQTFQYLKLKIALDTINNYEMFVSFKDNAKTAFDRHEDAPYMTSSSKAILFSLSSDNVPLALNQLPALNKQTTTIPLSLTAAAAGTYTINLDTVQNIPQLYDVLLVDNYKKDTTSLRQNPSHTFTVITGDSASNSKRRFNLMVRQNPALSYSLLNFNASKTQSGRQTQVDWTTKNEENYTNFTVERSTDGGNTFSIIGMVKADGSGLYSFTDKSPLMGTDLYRLQQQNINDSISYSKVIPLIFDKGNNDKVLVYPNPAKSVVNLDILAVASAGTSYRIVVTNSIGLVVRQATSNQSNWSTNISGLLPGTYLVTVLNLKDNTLVGQTKFVKL